jgi:hypothetical protein
VVWGSGNGGAKAFKEPIVFLAAGMDLVGGAELTGGFEAMGMGLADRSEAFPKEVSLRLGMKRSLHSGHLVIEQSGVLGRVEPFRSQMREKWKRGSLILHVVWRLIELNSKKEEMGKRVNTAHDQ